MKYRPYLALAVAAILPACKTTEPPDPLSAQPAPVGGGGSDHPLGSGSVQFVGFPADVLAADFRIIPEEGTDVYATSSSDRIDNVDGFWWRESHQWYKIPNHCHATISRIAGELQTSHDCSELGTRIQRLRRQPTTPGWMEDSGRTAHATDYPF